MENAGTKGFWLSPQQQRVCSLQANCCVSRAVCLVDVVGNLVADRLDVALRRAAARHEILRTVFRRQPGMKFPFQVVLENAEPVFEVVDLRSLGPDEQRNKVEELAQQQLALTPIPETEPVLCATLANVAQDRFMLVVSLPALGADSQTLQVLVQEIARVLAGEADQSGEEPLRYVQFAQWQADVLESTEDSAREGREFWAAKTDDLPSLTLPWEHKGAGPFSPRMHSFDVDAAMWRKLDSLATNLGTSAADILLAAWQSLLWRLSGQTTFKVGSVFDGRQFAELQGAIGLFEKTLPVESRFDGDLRFREVVAHVSATVSKASEWQEHFAPGRGFESEPPVSFEFLHRSDVGKHGDLSFKVIRSYSCSEHFKLKLTAVRGENDLALDFHYDASRFDNDSVERIAGYFQRLLAAGIENSESLVSRLPMLSEAERQEILVDWNQTASDYPKDRCLHELFESQVARTPERPALRFEDRELSYRELNQQANQMAHYLRKAGVGPDSLVGMCVDRSAEMIVALLAIMKAGGAYVPLHPDNPAPRLAQQLAGAVALITETQFLEKMPEFGGKTLCLDRDQALWNDQPRDNPPLTTKPDNRVYVIYTSGSTGVPKGVAVLHRNLVNYSHFITQRLNLSAYPQGLHFGTVSTLSADLGNTCVFPALISGGCLHVISYQTAMDAQQMAQYTTRHPLDVLKIVPSHLKALLYADGATQVLPRKYLIMGGEALSVELIEQIIGLGSGCEVLNHYGPTETTVGSLSLRLQEYDWKTATAASIPIGRPIANTQVYILDKQLEPVPPGVVGEVYIAGDGVTAGYLNQPERTAERFLPNPFVSDPAARMYRTGDLARHHSGGNVEFLGRGDDQVKIRGFRIELGEIESVLAKHRAVKQVIALAREDDRGDKRLLAYVVTDAGQTVSSDELKVYLKEQLPEYMVPSAIVQLPKFPLNANGKVDRQALPAPETVEKKVYIEPKTDNEKLVAKIWSDVLGRDHISADDNFFDLGGHSLLAVRAVAELEKVIGRRIPVANLFRGSTVASLAKMVGEGSESEPEPLLVKYQAGDGGTPPFFAVAEPGAPALGYAVLSRRIGENQGLYKLQAKGPLGRERPHTPDEVDALARQCIAAMRAVQPQGPYFLIAMCGGCRIAEQMILQLEAEGHEVGVFAVLDAWVLENVQHRFLWKLNLHMRRLRSLRKKSMGERALWFKRVFRNRIQIATGEVINPKSWEDAYWKENFQPPRFRAPILLFRRPKQPYYYINDPQMGWGARTSGGVEIHHVDTRHHEFLREPHVQIISQELMAHVRRAGRQAQAPIPIQATAESVTVTSSC